MAEDSSSDSAETGTNEHFLKGLARAFAGAIIFSFSIVMTMEMWSLGYLMPPYRVNLLVILSIPLLVGVSRFIGFKDTENLADDIIDAFVGYAVGFTTSATFLLLFGIIDLNMSWYEIIGKVTVQTVAAAIGAMFAQSQLGGSDENYKSDEEKKESSDYWGELFLMFIGAVFLAMNPASTEEIYLIAYKMTGWQIVILALASIAMMHAFVYSVGFSGSEKDFDNFSYWKVFWRFTIVGYAIALVVSSYLLWTFGSLDGLSLDKALEVTIVLGFPAALGAAASRVII